MDDPYHPLRKVTSDEVENFHNDGYVCLRGIISPASVDYLRKTLENVFNRNDGVKRGHRTDMTEAAAEMFQHGDKILISESGVAGQLTFQKQQLSGRFLTEMEVGRWNMEMRKFNLEGPLAEICSSLLKGNRIRFWGDHCFLKEPGSKIRTAFHQDAPYFPFYGNDACVCWVPVDSATKESGTMGYVRGSHQWREFAPNALVTRERMSNDENVPMLPNIEERESEYDIAYFDVEPGDVIVHFPRTVHGSLGNVSNHRRRLAASVRYVGEDVRWVADKATEIGVRNTVARKWKLQRDMTKFGSSNLFYLWEASKYFARGSLRSTNILPLGNENCLLDQFDYRHSPHWCYLEMKTGEDLGARDCSRCAFPLVYPRKKLKSKL